MSKKIYCLFFFLIAIFLHGRVLAGNVSGDVRGVTFFYLDGGGQDFPWVLDNQYNSDARTKIDNLLATYRRAGVNWIRLLIASDHFFVQSDIHPIPSSSLIKKVNDFMAITRSGDNAGKFSIELVLIPQQREWKFSDTYPYSRDKLWYKTWIDSLDHSNLGMIMFGGDLSPCWLSGCEGEASAKDLPRNHGAWIKELWSWKEANYPELNASYEVIGVQSLSENSPLLIKKLANWIDTNTPTNPFVAASLYITLPSGSSSQKYASATEKILDAYHSVSSKPLWIDEFGRSLGTQWTAQDQRNAYQGFLSASVCGYPNGYPKFAWVAGNDYPYDGQNWYGLVSGFTEGMPIMREAWDDLSFYYNLEVCPPDTEICEHKSESPGSFYIGQNYPNPFNSVTTIIFNIQNATFVSVKVYDVTSKVIATLVNEHKKAGQYFIKWDAGNFSSGLYYYKIIAGNITKVKKCILLK